MNKSDIKLVTIILLIIIIIFLIFSFSNKKGSTAKVYFEDKLILTIDLSIDKEYEVDGYLGKVVIEVKDKKIRVKEETSPKHLCSKEGYTDSNLKPIICLPNKIVIKVTNESDDIDGVVY